MTSEAPRPATPTIPFSSDPAAIDLSRGLSAAARYWRATVDLWSLPVALVAALTAVVTWVFGSAPSQAAVMEAYRPGVDPMTVLGPILPRFAATSVVLTIASAVAGWAYLAIAVAGLRGYRVTLGWILRRGVRALAADLLVTLGFALAFLAVAIPFLAVSPGLAVLALLAAAGPAVYLTVRLIFWTMAIFDGAGISQGLGATWMITRGAVLRMLGWGIGVAVLGLVVGISADAVTLPLGDGNPVRAGITAAVNGAFSVFSTIALAVIYESQRRRSVLRPAVPMRPAPGPDPAGPPPPPPDY